jgi:RHS repeat-associated protein
VSSATYNAAGQLTAMSTNAYTETRQYNANLQLTRLAAGGGQGVDFSYTYPASGNNGRISQMTDNITSEQVNYTYDVWNRLVQAGSMTFAYDGFGNLTQQGQTTLSINQNTNQINSAGYYYNANGNVTQTPNPTTFYTYDVANRLVSNGAIYNPRNQRVFDGTYIYLYTPEGKVVGKYTPVWSQYGSNAYIQGGQPNVYFGGKLIQEQGHWVMTDRLGSVRLHATNGRSTYQPYGAEVAPATSDQRTKFATYYRDSAGLDYAGQRYYSNVAGRFLTPDPGGMAADASDPGSWNRYAYVGGDPINFADRTGRFRNIVGNCGDLVNGQPQPGCDDGGDESPSAGSGSTCMQDAMGLPFEPNPLCSMYLPPQGSPVMTSASPTITLRQIDDCIYPSGTGLSLGAWTLEVEYQVLVNGRPESGNFALNALGIVIKESVQKTGRSNIDNTGGVWCPVGGNCDTAGSMNPYGDFWDVLAGAGTANQTFLLNGQPISVSFSGVSGSQTVLKNTYNSRGHTISVGGGALTGTSDTRECGSKNGDPTYH